MYLNHMLDKPQALLSQNQIKIQQMRQVTSSPINGYSSLLSNIAESNSNSLPFNSDPELSDLLEEVMDIMNVTSEFSFGTTTQTQTITQMCKKLYNKSHQESPSLHSQYQNSINLCGSQQQQTQNINISQTQQPGMWTQPRLTSLHPMLNALLQF
ncbi:uncharacterized protein LOC132936489 [Metopolophium dirhodum]|uniref:uncharacterized protein LOC132936489 n=1 Tax=Metopolophium dirhodum TaxID=44670 RepID=UPI00298F70FD|nr:uncharacterized protein LOC132936489 [Metopolophium dirhodum]